MEFIPYVHEFEFAQESQWGQVVLQLATKTGDYKILKDLELGQEIRLGGSMYTTDELGKLDGPGRYIRKPDPVYLKALKGLGALTKKERAKARKARRKAARQGITLTTVQLIDLVRR